jgi:hypothetical protein
VGEEHAVGLERGRHGGCRRRGSPANAGARGGLGFGWSGKGKEGVWIWGLGAREMFGQRKRPCCKSSNSSRQTS